MGKINVTCPSCNGRGRVVNYKTENATYYRSCNSCNGKGTIQINEG